MSHVTHAPKDEHSHTVQPPRRPSSSPANSERAQSPRRFSSRQLARQGILAAVYVVLTLSGLGISYGPVQFRFSEVLTWLAFLDPKNVIGLTLGCCLANLPSPFGLMDVVFGTLGTLLATLLMAKTRSAFLAALWPAAFSFIYSAEALLLGQITSDLYFGVTASIMLSEFLIVGVIGLPMMTLALKNERIARAFIDPSTLPTKASWTGTSHLRRTVKTGAE